jgi:hypothetical protein
MFVTTMRRSAVRSATTAAMGCSTTTRYRSMGGMGCSSVRCFSVCRRAVGSTLRWATMRCYGTGVSCGGTVVSTSVAARDARRWTTTILCVKIAAAVSTASDVTSASTTAESMITPTMTIAPTCPWADTEEDAVIEITRPIKTTWGAAVWCVFVIAVGTDWRIYADGNLCVQARHYRQGRQQNWYTH